MALEQQYPAAGTWTWTWTWT